jgi:chorismate mutase
VTKLEALRADVDDIDAALSDLLVRRFAKTDEILKMKRDDGLPAFDRSREEVVLRRFRMGRPRSVAAEILRLSKGGYLS